MKKRRTLITSCITATIATVLALTSTTSCNRMITYEDGMFDYNEIYTDDATNDMLQINSEIDNDDTERY